MKLRTLTSALLVLATALAAPAAFADTPAVDVAAPEAQQVHAGAKVSVAGEVGRYVVGPLGHVRGFILKDGTAVMLHDAAGDAMAKTVPVGESVRVEGWSPATAASKVVFRPAVYGQHGLVVAAPQRGAGGGSDPATRQARRAEMKADIAKLPAVTASGTVQTVITGRSGEAIGVVLTDGTNVFLRHGLIKAMGARTIRAGERIESTGKGATYALGTSMFARSVTFSDGTRFEAQGHRGAAKPTGTAL